MTDPTPSTPERVVCTLPPDVRELRRAEIRRDLVPLVLESRDLSDGIALRFAPERHTEVEAFVEFERGCCGFAGFETRSAPDGLWLEIRGPAGTRDFAWRMLDLGEADVANGAVTRAPGRWPEAARILRLGAGSGVAAALACLLCLTPLLGLGLGALGLAGATASVAFGLDVLLVPLVLGSSGAIAAGLWLRRRERASA